MPNQFQIDQILNNPVARYHMKRLNIDNTDNLESVNETSAVPMNITLSDRTSEPLLIAAENENIVYVNDRRIPIIEDSLTAK